MANFAERNTSFFSFCGLRKAQPQVKSSMSNKRILQSWAARHYAGSLGTLSKDGGDGSENVGKKMNLRSFKVNHVF